MAGVYELDPNSKVKAQMLEVAEKGTPHKSIAVKYLLTLKGFNQMWN